MRVTALSLTDFRNYESAEVSFSAGLNLVLGRNGQGKTNLVEAIAYFASLGSHRVSGDTALIRAGSDAAIVRMRIAARDRDVLLEVQINRGRANRAQLNRNRIPPRELPRWFSVVVFAPEDLSIVRGDPARRRNFLDEAVSARNPSFLATLADYDRVVRQRTSLLKSARSSGNRASLDATLGIWDEQLIDLGSRIMVARRELIRALERPLRAGYTALVEADHRPSMSLVETVYGSPERECVSRETLTDDFRSALERVRSQEIERAVTLVGPHRDDLFLELNGLPVKGYASHGESWSFALGLRLALAQLLRVEYPAGDPVLILDDVFAELDARRRGQLMSLVADFEQVIVTAAVEEDIPERLDANRIRIDAGSVVAGNAHGNADG